MDNDNIIIDANLNVLEATEGKINSIIYVVHHLVNTKQQ